MIKQQNCFGNGVNQPTQNNLGGATMCITLLELLNGNQFLSEFGVIIVKWAEEIVKCLEKDTFYRTLSPLVPLC